MALKIGRLEIGYRLLISLIAIAIGYGYVGAHLCTLWRASDYLGLGFLFALAIVAIFAIPQSVGGLLAAIASVITVYWQSSNLTYTLTTAIACLALYLLGFQDVRYESAPDKKLSIVEIVATVSTIVFAVMITLIIFQTQVPLDWLTSVVIGVIAGAVTLVGKQLIHINLSQKSIWQLLSIVSTSGLAIGLGIRAILYATTKATPNVM